MADQAQPARSRIALVYGDAASVGHLREAVSECVEIVYDTAAQDFDAARIVDSHATAALVNLDGPAWLDTIEAKLNEAGVTVVYNDPEISRNLEGWAQARWLRHLTAKLSGSSDFDPPRPRAEVGPAVNVAEACADAPEADAMEDTQATLDRPLSSAEIASMTADFVDAAPHVQPVIEANDAVGTEFNANALDVDTEALSAMIDVRLAENDDRPASDSSPVWIQRESHAAEPIAFVEAEEADAVPEAAAASAGQAKADAAAPALQALEDWQLVDPEAPVPAVDSRATAKTGPAISLDLSGIELVPMESPVADVVHSEPVEHHLYVDSRPGNAKSDRPAAQASRGGHAS